MNVFTIWANSFPLSGIRKECVESILRHYPTCQLYGRGFCEETVKEFFAEYDIAYPQKAFENDVLLSDYARAILLVRRENTLYIDTDIALHADLVFDPRHPAIGFENGNLCICLLYNAHYTEIFRKTIEPWLERREYLNGIFRFAFENVLFPGEYTVIKEGYQHFCLASKNSWANERNPL